MLTFNLIMARPLQELADAKRIKIILMVSFLLPSLLLLVIHWVLDEKNAEISSRILTLQQSLHTREQHRTGPTMEENKRHTQQIFQQAFLPSLETGVSGICISELDSTAKIIKMKGQALSMYTFNNFLTHWRGRYLFGEIVIDQLVKQTDHRVLFQITAFPNLHAE